MEIRYSGFWRRVGAAMIDAVVLGTAGFLMSMGYLHSHLRVAYGMAGYMPEDPGFATSLSAFVFAPLDAAESIFVFCPLVILYASIVNLQQLLKDAPDLWIFALAFPALNWFYHV